MTTHLRPSIPLPPATILYQIDAGDPAGRFARIGGALRARPVFISAGNSNDPAYQLANSYEWTDAKGMFLAGARPA
ncbi:MAG TPA: hypothetical protein VMH81_01940 [Bryobacteraceae bacterium]|nr:hypothetical protein [Bryobacteraceae bacterium]